MAAGSDELLSGDVALRFCSEAIILSYRSMSNELHKQLPWLTIVALEVAFFACG